MAMWNLDTSCEFVPWPELKLFWVCGFLRETCELGQLNTTPTTNARDLGWKISIAMGGVIEG